MKKMNITLRAVAAAALVTFGAMVASNASANSAFKVDPTYIVDVKEAPKAKIFDANQMSGSSSARIRQMPGSTTAYTGKGYIAYGLFTNSGAPVKSGISQLNDGYLLYATFTETFYCAHQLNISTTCDVTGISLQLYADIGNNVELSPASYGVDYKINNYSDPALLLANVTHVFSGTAGIDNLGGAYQNINTNFQLTKEGKKFFIFPTAFYTQAFSAFNNSSLGLTCQAGTGASCVSPTQMALNQEAGTTEFESVQVPEPASLGLFGLALAGVAVARSRKNK